MIVSELYRYPLKGGQGDALCSSTILGTGFLDDRRWLLVDAKGRFISQREHAKLALIRTVVGDQLVFQCADQELTLERGNSASEVRPVTVWGDRVEAWDLGDKAAEFFSRILGKDLRLCEAKPQGERQVDPSLTESQTVEYLFADSFPYLIISQESLDLLNEKLQGRGHAKIDMNRFRPNIVIKGWQAHAEDKIQTIRIAGKVHLRLAKPCIRCNVTTIDQKTGIAGVEPLATLAQYRKLGTSKIFFGMNAWVLKGAGATIQLGDTVEVI